MAQSLAGKTALITGGAKRIGRQISLALADEGANIVVHYRESRDEAEVLCEEIRAQGRQAWALQADFAIPDQQENLIEQALEQAGALDILVNNASIFPPSTLQNVTFDQLTTNLHINAWIPFLLMRSFASHLASGTIINTLDTRLQGYDWNHVAYILSKHVLEVLTRMAALEFAPQITVNAIAPGLILPPPGRDESYLDQIVGSVPLQRHGSAQDIADTVVFLAKSSFITGQIVYVDGGRHILEYPNGPNPNQ
jgi:pteridine reductase